jgi:hypothetical protein
MDVVRKLFGSAALVATLVATLVAAPAGADLAKWDQARVTGIAQQLAAACDAWEEAVRGQPDGARLGSGDAEDYLEMQQRSRFLREQSASLAAHLKDGKGREQTVHSYQALKEGVDDTEEAARRAFLAGPSLDAWSTVADLLRQIAPYYDPKALEGPKAADR